MKNGGEKTSTQHVTDEDITIIGRVALDKSLGALAVAWVGIARLLDTGEQSGIDERNRISCGAKRETKLLVGR
jgi:hypothetical protein